MKDDYSYSSYAYRVGKYQNRQKYEEGFDKIDWKKKPNKRKPKTVDNPP